MKNKVYVLSILFSVLLKSGLCFASRCGVDPFLQELIDTGDDFRAVTILKEREFRLRGSEMGFECARSLMGIYLKHQEFDVADSWLSRMVIMYPKQLARFSSVNRLRSEMAFLYGNYSEAQKHIVKDTFDGVDRLREFSRAASAPYMPHSISCVGSACDQLRAILTTATSPRLKSTSLALVVGIVPGMGQVYAGRTWSGLASFVLNSVLIGATVYGIRHGEYAFALLTGAASTGIYLGSIYAGYEAVRRYNEQLEADKRARIKGINIDMTLLQLAF